jgi:hypothetical protein
MEQPHANTREERFSCRNRSFGARVASISIHKRMAESRNLVSARNGKLPVISI